jgi:hypothetical protein
MQTTTAAAALIDKWVKTTMTRHLEIDGLSSFAAAARHKHVSHFIMLEFILSPILE